MLCCQRGLCMERCECMWTEMHFVILNHPKEVVWHVSVGTVVFLSLPSNKTWLGSVLLRIRIESCCGCMYTHTHHTHHTHTHTHTHHTLHTHTYTHTRTPHTHTHHTHHTHIHTHTHTTHYTHTYTHTRTPHTHTHHTCTLSWSIPPLEMCWQSNTSSRRSVVQALCTHYKHAHSVYVVYMDIRVFPVQSADLKHPRNPP